jgi:hypothetical protein
MSKMQIGQRARTYLAAQDLIRDLGGLKREALSDRGPVRPHTPAAVAAWKRGADEELCRKLREFAARWGTASGGPASEDPASEAPGLLLWDVFGRLRQLRAGASPLQIGTALHGGSHVEAVAHAAANIAGRVALTPEESDLAGLRQWIIGELAQFDPDAYSTAADGELRAPDDRPAGGMNEESVRRGTPPAGDDSPQLPDAGKQSQALACLVEHPDWTNKQIARHIGCHVKSLSRFQKFLKAKAALAGGKADRPKGRKTRDGSIEAEG